MLFPLLRSVHHTGRHLLQGRGVRAGPLQQPPVPPCPAACVVPGPARQQASGLQAA